jgi:hypothetical protein
VVAVVVQTTLYLKAVAFHGVVLAVAIAVFNVGVVLSN